MLTSASSFGSGLAGAGDRRSESPGAGRSGPAGDGRSRPAGDPAPRPTFVSTRGAGPATFAEALVQGLATDGGLYVPEVVPSLPEGGPGAGSFTESARWAARAFLASAMPAEALDGIVEGALDFDAPLVEVEPDLYVLELFHGPSLAFKDVGARFMARAMATLGAPRKAAHAQPATEGGRVVASPDGTRIVLVATSGDTGGAVASAFHGVAGARVVVLFPRHGISPRQRRQMTTLGGNVTAVAVDGTFDDCQRLAKAAFADGELCESSRLTSANSINVGRLIPQTFYYVHAAALLGWSQGPPTFIVPSGNLGNLCAGLLARRGGLPAARFVAASNANRVFPDYLDTGRFQARPSVATASNAMDVGDPSNLERIRWLYDGDVDALRADVLGISSDDDETRATIAAVFRRTGYVLDPHAAVGYGAAQKAGLAGEGPVVVLATAHPAKFPEIVEEATGRPVPLPAALAGAADAAEHWVDLAPRDADLRSLLLDQDRP